MPRPLQPACDACRRRKVKCSTQRPCSPCRSVGLACRSSGIQRKKGRQGASANVLTELQRVEEGSPSFSPQSPRPASAGEWTKTPGLVDPSFVRHCADYFFARMLGTVPILHPDAFQQQVNRMDKSGSSYCLVVAFCAFVLIQTGYRSTQTCSSDLASTLLDEATVARRHLDLFAIPIRQAIAVSFLLYGCHIGLGHQRHAYYFLREATTLYTADVMDSPDVGSDDLSSFSNQLFWLLLISERAHALRRRRPITLQITASSPILPPSFDPFTRGFSCLVDLYRPFDPSFLSSWNGVGPVLSRDALVSIEEHLQRAVPADSDLPDIVLADLRVSQQWLRTVVWQMATTAGYLSSSPTHPSLDFRYPLQIARDLALATWKLSRESMETHGIGLIEKVFEVACTLVDVMACLSSAGLRSSGFEIGPQDYLKHLGSLVERLPGGRARFLPLLMDKLDQTLPALVQQVAVHLGLPGAGEELTELKGDDSADKVDGIEYTEIT
ncbi:putative C6 finger domain protein [Aspergillus steynii IBT 23096]|uniref:Putative C6 finger domain protein n=1 Tax=Aspergillus steynii IBT 23096 TaxID=1392250 RepID=A0A2I2G3B7_9EURO|nr:putative C6 finger domain protein [Aspergillus steynii IBT 23096]PLB47370.1 putative C6 finger domain protein [Aspergillus steynii IBT 23096]